MTNSGGVIFNPDGCLKVRLRPISSDPRWYICQCNLHNGISFARQIVASFQHQEVKAWRHPVGKRYPNTVSVDLDGVRLALLTKWWTRTKNHDEAFYLTREFYESRRRGRYPDQITALTTYSRSSGAVPFLVAGLEMPDRCAVFVPFAVVETLAKFESKIGIGVFDGFPKYRQLADGSYDLDIAELRKLIRNLQDQEVTS